MVDEHMVRFWGGPLDGETQTVARDALCTVIRPDNKTAYYRVGSPIRIATQLSAGRDIRYVALPDRRPEQIRERAWNIAQAVASGSSFSEVARSLGITPPAVRDSWQRTLRAIAEIYSESHRIDANRRANIRLLHAVVSAVEDQTAEIVSGNMIPQSDRDPMILTVRLRLSLTPAGWAVIQGAAEGSTTA